jgi:hypothetical protein
MLIAASATVLTAWLWTAGRGDAGVEGQRDQAGPRPHGTGAVPLAPPEELEIPSPPEPRLAQAPEAQPKIGRLQVIDVQTLLPPSEGRWLYHTIPEATPPIEVVLDGTGCSDAPLGRGRLSVIGTAVDEMSVITGEVVVSAGDTATVWVHRRLGHKVVVRDREGRPVDGAFVSWRSKTGWRLRLQDPEFWEAGPDFTGATDADGAASLRPLGSPVGELYVVREGFLPAHLQVSFAMEQAVVVTLSPDPEPSISVEFLAADIARPLEGISVVTQAGVWPQTSDGAGRMRLPTWVLEEGLLAIQGPGICTSTLRGRNHLEQGPSERGSPPEDVLRIYVSRASLVNVSIEESHEGQPSPGRLLVREIEPAASASARARPPEHVDLAEGQAISLHLPVGSAFRLTWIALDGRSGSAEIRPRLDREEVTITPTSGSRLEVHVRTREGKPVETVRATVRYDNREEMTLETSSDGAILVPRPEDVVDLDLHAPDFVPIYLQPRRAVEEARRSGALTLTASRSHDLSVRLVDDTGRPQPGYLVEVGDERQRKAYRAHPDLWGSWPTGHPAWIETPRPPLVSHAGVSDGDGLVVLHGLAEGENKLDAKLHPMLIAGYKMPLQNRIPCVVRIPDVAEVVCHVPALRPVSIRALERVSRSPITGLTVFDVDGDPGPPARVEGDLWQGWVQAGHELDVSAPGLGSQRVQIDHGQGEVYREVLLDPADPYLLTIDGDVEELVGRTAQFLVQEPPRGRLVNPANVWSGRVPISTEPVPLFIPFESPAFVLLEIPGRDGQEWIIHPSTVELIRGEAIRFTVQRRATGGG